MSKSIDDDICKKVRFNLDKNTIKLISPIRKKNTDYNNYINNNSKYESDDNISIINDEVKFDNTKSINKIMNNSDFFNSTHHMIENPQVEYVKKLHKQNTETNDDIFQNQKGYWESQTIDDFTDRTYDNNQVAKFNEFRTNNNVGDNIASVYDNLSEVNNRDSANVFGESVLRHDDNSIMGNMSNTIYGSSSNCNQAEI